MDVDELYLTPPERFVAARNALAKAHPEVKGLKKPTPSAWLLNVLARRHLGALDALFRAGDALRAAQDRVLAGDTADAMQSATRDLRVSIASVIDEARAILAAHERRADEALLKKLSSLLRTISVDLELRETVRGGRLLADPGSNDDEEPGLEAQLVAPPKEDPREREERARKKREEAKARAKEALAQAEAEEDDARKTWLAAEDALAEARRVLEACETAFARADDRLTKARERRKTAVVAIEDATRG